jgi:hypothetical protein
VKFSVTSVISGSNLKKFWTFCFSKYYSITRGVLNRPTVYWRLCQYSAKQNSDAFLSLSLSLSGVKIIKYRTSIRLHVFYISRSWPDSGGYVHGCETFCQIFSHFSLATKVILYRMSLHIHYEFYPANTGTENHSYLNKLDKGLMDTLYNNLKH